MLQNYLKIALRNLFRFKGFTLLNTVGLSVGIAACLLIVQHLRDELRFDRHHAQIERLFRVGTSFNIGDETNTTATSPAPLAWTLAQDYPEVETAARLLKAPSINQYLVKYENRSYFEQKGYLVDSTFFRLFSYDFVAGNPETALNEPYSVVLSSALAEKYFGGQNPLYQTIRIGDPNGEYEFKVTGVFDEKTYRSHIDGNFYMNIRSTASGQRFHNLTEWAGNNLFYTYVRLRPGADPAALTAKLPALVEAKAGERLRTLGFHKEHFLEPVSEIYLHSAANYPVGPTGDISLVYVFIAIAVFILLIACINFVNLATAKATIRAREVGVRKVIGASRAMLIQQFMSESFVLSALAVVLAIAGAKIFLPWFNEMTGKELRIDFAQDPALLAWIGGMTIFTTFLAGSYPALYLSRFSPANIFRGKSGMHLSAQQVRRALVVLQFIVSVALIQGILVIRQQMIYIQNKDLGFEKDARIVVQMNTTKSMENYPALRQAFLKQSGVLSAGGSRSIPGGPNIEDMLFYGEGKAPDETVHSHLHIIDPSFLPTMRFGLVAGRFFEESRPADSLQAVVVSEAMARGLGYPPENAIGRKFFWNWSGEVHTQEIIGVVRDFHAASLRSEIDAHTFFWSHGEQFTYLVASVSTQAVKPLINALENSWQQINPGEPFEFYFLDDKLQQAYLTDQRAARLISAFTLLALFISCLGLFGLAAFSAESRTKEIGVRKVLGASVSNIVSLLSKDFLLLVLVAIAIATPLAWYFTSQWLQAFHYHINMPWWTFGMAGMAALFLALATVSWQSVRAALANPVQALRNE
ncbi:MAG: ABC transporter permease [Saprospirales bacterium]|nr:ABC transporter permease [Saprospirales bacterium]